MSELFVSSENQRADYPKYFRMLEEKLKKLQKSLSRKVKFSKNWYKQKAKILKLHEYIKNCRRDFLHKLSKKLSEAYNAVAVEDLNMKGMSQALNFGKSVGDNGWGMFLRMLEYKLIFSGKQFLIYSCNFDIFAFCLYQFLENFTFLDNDFCNFFNFSSNILKYFG